MNHDAECMLLLMNSLGLPNLSNLIDESARKFMDKLIDNCDFTAVLNVIVCNMSYSPYACVYVLCLQCILCVFFLLVSYVSLFAAFDVK